MNMGEDERQGGRKGRAVSNEVIDHGGVTFSP